MAIFVDTSALFAVLDKDDQNHPAAELHWDVVGSGPDALITTNYVLVETVTLVQRRLGLRAVREFLTEFVPLLRAHWVDEALHQRAVSAMMTAGARNLSLVDCVSFEAMRRLDIDTAFTFDAHFTKQGFQCIP